MLERRRFLQHSVLGSLGIFLGKQGFSLSNGTKAGAQSKPVVISTWAPNQKANAVAWKILAANGKALDALEKGIHVTEADPTDQSVGYGGLPDRDGRVTVDSCVMDERGNCGAVMCLEHILHPVSVARLVMEKTPHVQLVGEGALKFALSEGFEKVNLLTPEAEKAWKNWLKTSKYDPMITVEHLEERNKNQPKQVPGQQHNHDTIGMLALDMHGNLSGACSTSGMAFKMAGRVGDSPIIGAGLYVDNEVGAATATGVGEEIVRVCGSHTIVEMMRNGLSPEAACKKAVERIVKRNGIEKARNLQAGFIAINKQGEVGAYSVIKGFNYAVHTNNGPATVDAKFLI
ncbi:N(4)-(beta-N-acetylglucosaminyl)-L-asparaginase [Flavihumibacter sp. CACIAM 22H1]|uniref:isoaspartyl peptidase/L-asparaginase family protein n=1 Tax=Flavihumibacter sp. CACIAM 22H1 TaxID=1812911 RepID=UPI0007A91FF9|nr:N(4)-(beta-N-acetylglucosaminyl)-L-asparaginase [Flavihumibacter sp. CACIAM 22H1]KYP14756.1 MAG: glycosylasparaginase [Flavihumibacter sp. CACIAM 22H1]